MNKLYWVSYFVVALAACESKSRVIAHWLKDGKIIHPATYPRFDESNTISGPLHGRQVTLRGRLVYEYDEAAIHPIQEGTNFAPVWICVGSADKDLHSFLLQHDEAIVSVAGMLDTTDQLADRDQYCCAVREIASVQIHYVRSAL